MSTRPKARRGTRRYDPGRVCEADGCSVLLSVFNADDVCAQCHKAIDLMDLPDAHAGAYL